MQWSRCFELVHAIGFVSCGPENAIIPSFCFRVYISIDLYKETCLITYYTYYHRIFPPFQSTTFNCPTAES